MLLLQGVGIVWKTTKNMKWEALLGDGKEGGPRRRRRRSGGGRAVVGSVSWLHTTQTPPFSLSFARGASKKKGGGVQQTRKEWKEEKKKKSSCHHRRGKRGRRRWGRGRKSIRFRLLFPRWEDNGGRRCSGGGGDGQPGGLHWRVFFFFGFRIPTTSVCHPRLLSSSHRLRYWTFWANGFPHPIPTIPIACLRLRRRFLPLRDGSPGHIRQAMHRPGRKEAGGTAAARGGGGGGHLAFFSLLLLLLLLAHRPSSST